MSLQVTLSPRIFEGREEDRTSNEAKRALLLLFERVGLTATQGALSDELKKELLKDHSVIVLHQDGDEEKDMLSGDQVLDIYSRAQERELSFSGMDPKGPGMKLTLRDYQRVALEFMYNKETVVNPGSRTSLSTLWLEYKAQGDGTFFYFNPYTGMMSLEFQTEEHCAGGILADDMGLGKTIEILSLIHSNRFVDEVDVDAIDNDNEKLLSKATYVYS